MKLKLFPISIILLVVLSTLFTVTTIQTGQGLDAFTAPLRVIPTLTAIEPNQSMNDLNTPIVISGTSFEATPAVFLGETELRDVNLVSETELEAIVPWGINPGTYTIQVINPGGETASLNNAFTVNQGIGVWTTGGPYGGDVRRLVLSPENPNHVFASIVWSGLYASFNAAGVWQPVYIGGFPEQPAFDAGDHKLMYLTSDGGLHRSKDGGLTWESIPRERPERPCADAVRPISHPSIPGTVYLAVVCPPELAHLGGLHESTDWGESWATLISGMNITSVIFNPNNVDEMYLSSLSGKIYTSSDGGQSWTFAVQLGNHIDELYMNPFGEHEVWAVSNGTILDPPMPPNLFKSLNAYLTDWETITIIDAPVWSLTFHPTIPGTIYAGVDDGYFSVDGGDIWSPVGPGLPGKYWAGVKQFAIDPTNPALIYAATGAGVYKSSDHGNTWNEANQDLSGILPIAMSVSPFDPQEVYVNTNIPTLLKTNNGGQSWQELDIIPPGWSTNLAADPFIPGRVYFGGPCDEPCFRLSEDGGETYRELSYTLPEAYAGGGAHTLVVAPDPHIPGHILIASNIVFPGVDWGDALMFSSDDYGESWQHLSGWPLQMVKHIVYDPVNAGVVYASSIGLYKSTDSGLTWQALTADRPDLAAIDTLVVHPHNSDMIFIGVGCPPHLSGILQGIHRSVDGGLTWEFLPQGYTGPLRALAFTLTDPPTLYAGGLDSGLLKSTDNGLTWEHAAGMTIGSVQSLAVANDDERIILYVGITGGAITQSGQMGLREDESTLLLGSGIYRLTTMQTHHIYLPLMFR